MSEGPNVKRQARALAERLGCRVEQMRMLDGSWGWLVRGPAGVYPVCGGRGDPCEFGHSARGWPEVLVRLRVYERDLHFYALGISSNQTGAILGACEGEPNDLLGAWLLTPDDSTPGLVLADWLEETASAVLAEALREGIRTAREEAS